MQAPELSSCNPEPFLEGRVGFRVQGLGFRVTYKYPKKGPNWGYAANKSMKYLLGPPALEVRNQEKSQYPLIKAYTLNHNTKAPII